MTDNAKMVDLPWVDGTTRTVSEWTVYQTASGAVCAARDGGYSDGKPGPNAPMGETIHPHFIHSRAVRILTEAPEPPVKVNVPTGLGAIVSLPASSDYPGFVLTQKGWRGLRTDNKYDPSEIAVDLRYGARVLFEGVGEDTP